MHQISSPREQVGVNQHGPLRFGREEILMWLPQGSEEADLWRSSLGISHIPQGRGSGVHGGGRGCVLLALLRGNGGGIPGVSCVPLPTLGIPALQHWEPRGGSCGALLGLLQCQCSDRLQKRHWGNIEFLHKIPSFFPLRLKRPYLSYVHLQCSNPLLYPYLGKNSIFIVTVSSLHQ